MTRASSSYPRCRAALKDGSPCRTHAAPGSDYCSFHGRILENALNDDPQGSAEDTWQSAEETEPEPLADHQTGRRDEQPVADVRSRLAQDAAEEYEVLRGALLDALKAEREAFTTCPDCGKRHPVIVPDWTARVKAVETLLNQGFGRQPERVEAPPANRFEKLTDEQLQFWGVVRVFEDVEEAALAPLEHEIERAKKRLPDRVNSSQGHEEFREATAELRVKKEQRRELVRRTLAELMHMDDATREHVGELVDSGALIEWLDEASR